MKRCRNVILLPAIVCWRVGPTRTTSQEKIGHSALAKVRKATRLRSTPVFVVFRNQSDRSSGRILDLGICCTDIVVDSNIARGLTCLSMLTFVENSCWRWFQSRSWQIQVRTGSSPLLRSSTSFSFDRLWLSGVGIADILDGTLNGTVLQHMVLSLSFIPSLL